MDSETRKAIYQELIQIGCCKRCGLRYVLGELEPSLFSETDIALSKLDIVQDDDITDPPAKRKKENSCIACLGLLHDSFLDKFLDRKYLPSLSMYDKNLTYHMHLLIPSSVALRERSVLVHIKEKFPDALTGQKIHTIKRTWRHSIQERIEKFIDRKFSETSRLFLEFVTYYPLEQDEAAVLNQLIEENDVEDFVSKRSTRAILKVLSNEEIRKLIRVPPKPSLEVLYLRELKCSLNHRFITGTYFKYSRYLPQIPAHGDTSSDSVKNIITNAIQKVLSQEEKCYAFEASGYDSSTTRVLGNGRMFCVQIVTSRYLDVGKMQFAEIEKEISKSGVIAVKNLVELNRKQSAEKIVNEKHGDRKYKLLCVALGNETLETYISRLNSCGAFEVTQKTPIKYVETRTVATRKKQISNIYAEAVPGSANIFTIDFDTNFGLHLEEFVNGEIGRTKPSIASIIEADAELLAVDIIGMTSRNSLNDGDSNND